jgi:hypothetical protein
VAQGLQLFFAAAGNRPAQRIADAILRQQVLGYERSREARGAPDDDVEVFILVIQSRFSIYDFTVWRPESGQIDPKSERLLPMAIRPEILNSLKIRCLRFFR